MKEDIETADTEAPPPMSETEIHTRALRAIDKRKTAAKNDADSIARGRASFRRYLAGNTPTPTQSVALDELAKAEKSFEDQVAACLANARKLRTPSGDPNDTP